MVLAAAERWAAARRVFEDGKAGFATIARLTGCGEASLARRVRREGWRAPQQTEITPDHLARLRRELARWIGRIETLGAALEAGEGGVDKADLDAALAAFRALEKAEDMARAQMTEDTIDNDAEKAAVLEKINQRIVALAHEFAAEIVDGGGGGGGASGGMDAEPG